MFFSHLLAKMETNNCLKSHKTLNNPRETLKFLYISRIYSSKADSNYYFQSKGKAIILSLKIIIFPATNVSDKKKSVQAREFEFGGAGSMCDVGGIIASGRAK